MKILVLKLKLKISQPDVSSMDSDQINTFIDAMIGDFRETFTHNIQDIRELIKSARPDSSDPNYPTKIKLYQELLTTMVSVIQQIEKSTEEILTESNELINQLWEDICKNDGKEIDRLLEEHTRRMKLQINRIFTEPLDEEDISNLRLSSFVPILIQINTIIIGHLKKTEDEQE